MAAAETHIGGAEDTMAQEAPERQPGEQSLLSSARGEAAVEDISLPSKQIEVADAGTSDERAGRVEGTAASPAMETLAGAALPEQDTIMGDEGVQFVRSDTTQNTSQQCPQQPEAAASNGIGLENVPSTGQNSTTNVPGGDNTAAEEAGSDCVPPATNGSTVDAVKVDQIAEDTDGPSLLDRVLAVIDQEERGMPADSQIAEAAEASHPNPAALLEPAATIDSLPKDETATQPQEAEWEADSSPIDSSSVSDTSSDTSSMNESDEEDADEDGGYAMLSPEEQARILMQGDGGSDDEGNARNSKKGEASQLRTANEKPEEVVPKPSIEITEDMKIQELGNVEAVVENTVLVKANISGEYKVLESNSLLCLQNRNVVGVVSETLGRVEQPLYTIRFTNAEAIQEAGVSQKNTRVYYVEGHSSFVFTQPLRAVKGSDASNFHDEEVGAEEMEFSDDEAEMEHKRQLKMKRQGRKDERSERLGYPTRGRRGGSINGSAAQHGGVHREITADINYDDIPPMGEDGYNPLVRPENLHEMMGRGEAPMEGRLAATTASPRGNDRGRGRGQGRGRDGRSTFGRGGSTRGGHRRGGRDRGHNILRNRQSFSNGHASSLGLNTEPFSPSKPQQQQQQQQLSSPLPNIPPPSQFAYPQSPQMDHRQHQNSVSSPRFSYHHPTPPQAPAISPQPSPYQSWNPSPITPLPPTQFAPNPFAFPARPPQPSQQAYGQQQQQQQQHSQPSYQPHQPFFNNYNNQYQHNHQQPYQQQQQTPNYYHHQPPTSPYTPQNPSIPQQQHQPLLPFPNLPINAPPPPPPPQVATSTTNINATTGTSTGSNAPPNPMPPPGSHINPAFLDMLNGRKS